ncbi:DUF2652 domain-containing protein [Aureibaculum sp. 2210JD6-5]|uniref:DUF2652 domain-containing protein n=1 Tax=Aureibaculum sp. 2210JD6-5 TaxID=3103957 RepID=UPI002AAEB929|nr:DUF2652 domain-containing protein [Aureibaculum sp. 2210JD6-5]MDY7394961.1 DUF2652 domain-containing protein [Aureibaculum sp. 2210JD6-5]
MASTPTLICIPDISGFTEFMSNSEIELSTKVIPTLLNNIIYSNEIGLKVSEIEGDAVLFYKSGTLPGIEILVNQCRYFYTEFYKQLKKLRKQYAHMEDSVKIPEILGLKIILHYGEEVSVIPIGKSIKLIGEDVIIAHRLLKNEIKSDEYLLLSSSLLDQYNGKLEGETFSWGKLNYHQEEYDHIGLVKYAHIDLKPLVD